MGLWLVTGASGGRGWHRAWRSSDQRGYEVWAATGKEDEIPRLRELGATGFLTRDEVTVEGKPLESARWAGAVDGRRARPRSVRAAHGSGRRHGGRERERQRAVSSMPRSCVHSCAASRCSA
jgi:hypothetical protein